MAGMANVGKQYPGQVFVPSKTLDQVLVEQAEQAKYSDGPEAVPLEVYFHYRQIRTPEARAAMAAFTTVRRATLAEWDNLFKTF